MGTSAARAARQAKSVRAHSGRFSETMATRSPGCTPSSRRPSEIACTRWEASRCVIGTHMPAIFERNANGRSACRSTVVKNSWLSVPLFMIYSWLELHDKAHRTARHVGAIGAPDGGRDDDRIRERPRLEPHPLERDAVRVRLNGRLGE